MPIEYREGDLFESGLPALGHGCNCMGSMGAGIALEFRRRWPAMYDYYNQGCAHGWWYPGNVLVWPLPEVTIFNLMTQPTPGPTAKLEYIATAVSQALTMAHEHGLEAIGLPRIGAGLGGLEWTQVRTLLEGVALTSPVKLVIYSLPGSV